MSSRLSERLRDLKISRDLLASKTSLSRQRAAEIIGGAKADVSEVRQICAGLRLPVQIFSDRESEHRTHDLAPLFRSARDASSEYDITVERISIFVQACLEVLPTRSSLPEWLDFFPDEGKSYAAADRLSKIARLLLDEENADGPIANLPQLLGELEGLILTPLDHTRYEGISLIAGNYCFIFVSPRFAGRMLFTIGHEFGHLISDHREVGYARFEKPSEIGTFGKSSRVEAFVDAFSSCLLVPDTGIGKFLTFLSQQDMMVGGRITDREILYIARFFGVSFDVAGLRLENLGLIPEGLTFNLSNHLRGAYGSPEKRADFLHISPRSQIVIPRISPILSKALISAISDGEVSVGWASNSFGFSIGEIFAEQAKAS